MRVGYHIVCEESCGAQSASAAKIEVLDPDLVEVYEVSATAPPSIPVDQDNTFPDFNLSVNKPGTWRFLVSAWDNHPAHDRNHVNRINGVRPLLQCNKSKERREVMAFIDAGHGPGDKAGTPGSCDDYDQQRYPKWGEHEAVAWTRDDLKSELTTHGHEQNTCGIGPAECLWTKYDVQYVFMLRRMFPRRSRHPQHKSA